MSAEREDSTLTIDAIKQSGGMVVVLGIATVITGILAMMAPFLSGTAATVLVGILLIAAGITRTIFAFKAESRGKGMFTFLLGLLTVVCGLFILARPLLGLISLTLLSAGYFFADGIVECIAAFKMRPLHGWVWMLFSGFAAIGLGFLIAWEWPASGIWAVGLLVGVRLIFAGGSMIALGAAGRSIAHEADAMAAA